MTPMHIIAIALAIVGFYTTMIGMVYQLNIKLGVRDKKDGHEDLGPAKFRAIFWIFWLPILLGQLLLGGPIAIARWLWKPMTVRKKETVDGGPFRSSEHELVELRSRRLWQCLRTGLLFLIGCMIGPLIYYTVFGAVPAAPREPTIVVRHLPIPNFIPPTEDQCRQLWSDQSICLDLGYVFPKKGECK